MMKWNEMENVKIEKVIERMLTTDAHWGSKSIFHMYKNGELNFDNALQRGLVWDDERKSLLIHSLITGFPIDTIKAIKDGDHYDILDGKQRLLATLILFMDGQFTLVNMPTITVIINGEEEEIDLNGAGYNDLPEVIKNILDCFTFDIKVLDENTPDEMVNDMFFRCNNYKPMSAIDLTRAKAKSQTMIREIAKHSIFEDNLTKKALEKYTNEDIVIKSYIMLNIENPSLDTKDVRPIVRETEMTERDKDQLNKIFDRIEEMHTLISEKDFSNIDDAKEKKKMQTMQNKIAKRLVTRTHMISVVPFIQKSIDKDLTVSEISEWFEQFFNGKVKATNSATYNEFAGTGANKKESVRRRNAELNKNFEKWLKKLNEAKLKAAVEEDNRAEEETEVIASEVNESETINDDNVCKMTIEDVLPEEKVEAIETTEEEVVTEVSQNELAENVVVENPAA